MKRFYYAFKGIYNTIRTEFNAKVHLVATFLVIAAGLFYRVEIWEWCLLIAMISIVHMAETFNTSIEILTDHVQPDFHVEAGKVKDAAAGAVLWVAMGAAAIGVLIFGPRLFL